MKYLSIQSAASAYDIMTPEVRTFSQISKTITLYLAKTTLCTIINCKTEFHYRTRLPQRNSTQILCTLTPKITNKEL